MTTKPNIGTINALIRITCGLTMLAWCTAKMVKRPWRQSYLGIAMFAAMRVGEGIVRYCPVTALFEKGQKIMEEQNNQNGASADETTDQKVPYNPT
jgi:hypothetical protein